MRAQSCVLATVLWVHPGLLSPRLERPRSRGAALLLTVLVVLTAATITAVLVQVTVQAAGGQKRRLAHDSATEQVLTIERRVANTLSQDPLRVFSEVLEDEPPRFCSADPVTYPSAFSPGSAWPASCGALWSYEGTGNLARGARVFPPSPDSPVWTIEAFAEVGSERVGVTRRFILGGRDRPMLYAGGPLTSSALGSSLTVSGPVYSIGALDLTGATLASGVLAASEDSVAGAAGGLLASPSGTGGVPVRGVVAAPLPSSTLTSSLGELGRLGCLDASPANVDGLASSLCLRAGSGLVTSTGVPVSFPAAGSYASVLLVPLDDARLRVYTRPTLPAEWPSPLSEWTEVGVFALPGHGVVVTDVPTVLGHCDETSGACRDWDGDGVPGSTLDSSFTLVVGSPDAPADLRVGGPLLAGDGRAGAVVSGLVRFPVAASPAALGLEVDLWLAVAGRPGFVSLASEGAGSRPSLSLEGALLLADFSADLSGFVSRSVSVPAGVDSAPPFFPSPGLIALPDAAARIEMTTLDALFAAGEASGFAAPSSPGLLEAAAADTSVALSWSAPTDDGGVTVTDYVVEYRATGAPSWSVYADGTSTTTSASLSGLVNGTGYDFRVAAVNGVGRSPFSGTLQATPFLAPNAPAGLAVAVVEGSDSSLSLSWSAVTNVAVDGYNVYRLNAVSGLYELVASPVVTSYLDSGLTPGVSYSYKVAAFTALGEGPRSAAASASTGDLTPLAPSISSSSRGDLTVTLNFTGSPSAERPVEGFTVYVDGSLVATIVDPTATSYTFTGLVDGETHAFGVAAFNDNGSSAVVSATVTVLAAPGTVTGLAVVPEAGVPESLELTWSAPTNVVPNGFYVYRENVLSGVFEVIATIGGTSYQDSMLSAGELYSYRVSAFVDDVEGGLSSTVSETAIDVPYAAVVLLTTLADLEVTIDFVVDEDAGHPIDGYRMFLDGIEVDDLPAASVSYTFTGLDDGFTYEFSVLAYNTAGEGAADAVMATAYALPAQVTGLTVTPSTGSDTSLDLAWDQPSASFTGFYVYRLNATSGLFEVVATEALASYVDSPLLSSTSYTYRVAAYNEVGTGPVSSSVAGSTSTPFALSYVSTAFSLTGSSESLSPSVIGGTAQSFAYTGVLPTGVTFSTTTGAFTGSAAWNFEASQVVASSTFSCARTRTGGVKCWGANASGQLGDNSTTQRLTPVDVSGLTSGVAAIALGESHACALTNSGGVKCWGLNGDGQLGDNSTTQRLTPVDVSGLTSGVASIAAGSTHTCARTTGGGVKCWGNNGNGQLGDASTTSRLTPVDVSGLTSGVAALGAGGSHTCAVTTGGGAKCWGLNGNGQLGDASTTQRTSPVDVSGLTSGVASIAGGLNHTCAVTTGAGAKCWGLNGNGQLGDASTTQRTSPVDVSGLTSGVASVDPGNLHTCATTTSGGVKCWGYNNNGHLGDNTKTQRTSPVDVSGLTSGAASASAGGTHSCAIVSASGAVQCWGINNNGRLGDNSTSQSLVPVTASGSGNTGFPASITVTVTDALARTADATISLTLG